MNYPEAILSLTTDQQRLLCQMAYTNGDIDEVFKARYHKNNADAKLRWLSDAINIFSTRGLIVKKSTAYWNNSETKTVATEYYFYILFFLFTEHPDWLQTLWAPNVKLYDEFFANECNIFIQSLVNIYHAAVTAKAKGLKVSKGFSPKMPNLSAYGRTAQFLSYITPIIHEDVMIPTIPLLPKSVFKTIFASFIGEKFETDPQATILWARRLKECDKALLATYHTYFAELCINIYFATGEWLFTEFSISSDDYYYKIAEMTRLAIAGDYATALSTAQEALRIYNRNMSSAQKNIFGGYLSNYVLAMLYVLDDSDASRKKLEAMTHKPLIRDTRDHDAVDVICTYFKDTAQTIAYGRLTDSLYHRHIKKNWQGPAQLSFLLVKYLGISADKIAYSGTKPSLKLERYIPSVAFIRHELQKYLPISDEERQQLNTLYGGEPLLTRIRRKEQWEVILENIFQKENSNGDDAAAKVVDARCIYICNKYNDEVDVREQRRLKSGAWSKGKNISDLAYYEGRFAMDDIDAKIHEKCRRTGDYSSKPRLTAILPYLAGTDDRLMVGTYYRTDYEPLEVREEKPFISLQKDDVSIRLQTNIPEEVNLETSVIYHFDEDNYRITYYPTTPKERQMLQQLSLIGTMPLDAEPLLQQVFPLVSKTVEVHTDFIEGAEQLEEVQGESIVCLRITQQASTYLLTVSVTPLKGGCQSFTPGKGERIIFDAADGTRYQVKRSLKREKNNAALFIDYLEEEGIDTMEQPILLQPDDLLLLLDFARDHQDEGFIEWPEGEKVHLKAANPSEWKVSLKSHGGWFDLEGNINIDDDTVLSMAQLLDMVSISRSRFIRLADDQYLALSESLRKQLARLSAVASTSRNKTQIPAVGVALLGDALDGDLEIKHPKAVSDLKKKIRQSAKLEPEVPEELNATLRDYQLIGYQWMTRLDSWGAGACLADDMGLGKTIQAIAFMLAKKADGAALVLAPASVVPNWKAELHRFAPTLQVIILNEQADRQQAISDADSGTVIVSTYGLTITQEEAMVDKKWGTICLDEAHTIKNRDTKQSAVCMKLQSQHRIILTGTPLQNHLGELWNLFNFVNSGLLGSYEQFSRKFIAPIEAGGNTERRQLLQRTIKPFMLRRTKQEVATELPDKEEITLHVELSASEMSVYEVIRRKAKEELEGLESAGKKVNMNALAEITRLRMASCSAKLAEKSWSGTCSKLDTFTELVTDLYQNHHRALVFSQFTSFLDMAKDAIAKCPALKEMKYFCLDGTTPMKKREQMVKAFQKGEGQLFIISLKAGGLGLNLTGANYVIHLDPWWNPAIEQQATDRAHRIGQTEKVTVYHLISANTIEEKILRLHEHKRDLATSLLDGTNESHKITAAQLLEMIDGK